MINMDGHVTMKSRGQSRVLTCDPCDPQVYLLMCRAAFPEAGEFEKVSPLLSIALASLHPLSDQQMFRALNAGSVQGRLGWEELQRRLHSLDGFMVGPAGHPGVIGMLGFWVKRSPN
jgi:hypothetical protein